MKTILALILARGGSKGIPRKNLVPVCGKPLIYYSIQQALRSKHITRTIVSTDDPEIAETSRALGAEVPFIRPEDISRDDSTDLQAFQHALTWLEDKEAYSPELIVHLRPTGPVRQVAIVDDAIDRMLADESADSLRSVSVAQQTPYKMWTLDGDFLKPVHSLPERQESFNAPRQSLPVAYWQNGYVDIVRPRIIKQGLMSGEKILSYVTDEPILEIDYIETIPLVEEALR
ncbi:MAG: cytidylyltransferase domain-containing protein, partial [Rhodothermia bacterium]